MSTGLTGEEYEYAKRHLLFHMQAAGMSDAEIEARIIDIPVDHPLKAEIANQFLETLPEGDRETTRLRLFPT